MKVPHRQKLRGLLFQPPSLSQGLALGTVAVTAGVISRALKAARVAAIQMPAQLLGATGRNGPHHFFAHRPICDAFVGSASRTDERYRQARGLPFFLLLPTHQRETAP